MIHRNLALSIRYSALLRAVDALLMNADGEGHTLGEMVVPSPTDLQLQVLDGQLKLLEEQLGALMSDAAFDYVVNQCGEMRERSIGITNEQRRYVSMLMQNCVVELDAQKRMRKVASLDQVVYATFPQGHPTYDRYAAIRLQFLGACEWKTFAYELSILAAETTWMG